MDSVVSVPRLVCIAGPRTGAVFPLGDAESSIGRHSANQIAIVETTISRRHCVLRKTAQGIQLNDLESRNGTFVNGLPITERVLEHGDRIRAGASTFLFLVNAEQPEWCPIELNESQWDAASSVGVASSDAIPTGARAASADFEALFKINTALC